MEDKKFVKRIVKKKIEEKEKGGDKENRKPKIYKMGKIGEFLQRKSILKERPVQKSLIIVNCGPERKKSTNGEQSTNKSTTAEIPTKRKTLQLVTNLQDLRKVQEVQKVIDLIYLKEVQKSDLEMCCV